MGSSGKATILFTANLPIPDNVPYFNHVFAQLSRIRGCFRFLLNLRSLYGEEEGKPDGNLNRENLADENTVVRSQDAAFLRDPSPCLSAKFEVLTH